MGEHNYIFKHCKISKAKIFDGVWLYYNSDIPVSENEYYKKHENYDDYDYGSYETYKRFNDRCYRDLDTVLDAIQSPLKTYTDTKKYDEIPVIIAATFAAIMNVRKENYEGVKPQIIVDKLTCPVNERSSYNFSENEFLESIIISLETYFGLDTSIYPESGISGMDFHLRINDEKFGFGKTVKTSDGERIDLTKTRLKKEIIAFKKQYCDSIDQQVKAKVEAKEIIEKKTKELRTANLGQHFTESIEDLIRKKVFHAYGLNSGRKDELEKIYPLDYLGHKFYHYHDLKTEDEKEFFGDQIEGVEYDELIKGLTAKTHNHYYSIYKGWKNSLDREIDEIIKLGEKLFVSETHL